MIGKQERVGFSNKLQLGCRVGESGVWVGY